VDWKKLGIPDYPKIIKKPMDLSKVDKKLGRGDYATAEFFMMDMQLIFANAKTFNAEGSQIYEMAQNVENTFMELYNTSFSVRTPLTTPFLNFGSYTPAPHSQELTLSAVPAALSGCALTDSILAAAERMPVRPRGSIGRWTVS